MKIYFDVFDQNLAPGAYQKFQSPLLKEAQHQRVDSIALADIVITQRLNNKRELPEVSERKLVVLDWSDFQLPILPCRAYFQKAWADCIFKDGVYIKIHPKKRSFPLQEMALEHYFVSKPKEIELSCLLRGNERDKPNRYLVLETLRKRQWGKSIIGAIHEGKLGKQSWRSGFPKEHLEYLQTLASSKITVTCSPSLWEGDSRLWEALACGSCVISDRLVADMGYNPQEGVHCLYYDLEDVESLFSIIDSINDSRCEEISQRGRELVAAHHTPKRRLEQILSIVDQS